MKPLKYAAMIAFAVAPLGSIANAASPDDIGACYQTLRISGQTQCNVVERQFCFSTWTISARFVKGGDCSD